MECYPFYNQTKFLQFVPKIRQDIKSWQVIDVSLTGKTRHNAHHIAKKLKAHFDDKDGINDNLPKHSCVAEATDITADGLPKLQIRLEDITEEGKKAIQDSPLLIARRRREERIVMVADDDMFMRSLVTKTFQKKKQITELDDLDVLVETYPEVLPDTLFLDSHLPGGAGIKALEELLSFDDSAHVVIISSDSVRNNVLNSKKTGAKAFIAKPFTPEKLEDCYNKCPTTAAKK